MQLNSDILNKITYLIGSDDIIMNLPNVPAKTPFCEQVVDFLNEISKELMRDVRSRTYSEVVTFAFWIRKTSVLNLKERFEEKKGIHLGRGVAFHIAPSNVPVNFAYSVVSGLLTGNANVVKVPSKDFPQIDIIVDAINSVLEKRPEWKSYIICIRYDREKEINDLLSSMADIRIVWGGDQTIQEIRKSQLPPRSGEITFADRYSLAVIDSDTYMEIEDKEKVAVDFYNDTFFSDQNACTSPRIIIWLGSRISEAKEIFWDNEHALVEKKYTYQSIQGVNKLTNAFLVAATESGIKIENHKDNLIIRVNVSRLSETLMDYVGDSGYFYEYDCKDIASLAQICNDKRCQTIGYIGNGEVMVPLIESGVKGIDRIVPMGKTMDFDLIWDGYNLTSLMTRSIVMV